jgi:diphthamide biosynthesis protein 7
MSHSLHRKAFFKTDSPPCCLRINPLDPSIVYFGTYTLIQGNQRKGSIEIWKLNESELNSTNFDVPDDKDINVNALAIKGEHLKTINTHGAVLDIKFDNKSINSSDESLLLSTAHSTGNVTFWKINKQDPLDISEIIDIQLFDEPNSESDETLITSINFHPRNTYLSFTTTTGYVGYYDYEKFPSPEEMNLFETKHSLEAWYADWCHLSPLDNVIFSGGDDAQLIAHDIRAPFPIFTNSRIHEAGIVSILTARDNWCKNVTDPYIIWTGGYDDQLCVLDLRAGSNTGGTLIPGLPPLVKEKHNLGGGVWRLIPSPKKNDHRVFTCNMYDGGRIVSYDPEAAGNLEVTSFYKGDHSSITYGGDWVENTAVSCSFYDNVVQVWDV